MASGNVEMLRCGVLSNTSYGYDGNSSGACFGMGGGVYCDLGHIILMNCEINTNTASSHNRYTSSVERSQGGGIYVNSAALDLSSVWEKKPNLCVSRACRPNSKRTRGTWQRRFNK